MSGDTPAQITGGYGGWDVVNRPKRKGLTQWNGKDPMRLQLPIMFDGWMDRDSQEIPISRLHRMSLPPAGVKQGEPPIVAVGGNGVPHSGIERWVIENLLWGTNVLWDKDRSGSMSRMRQDCVVNLIEFVDEDRVAFSGIAVQPTTTPPKSTGQGNRALQYTVQQGDSLTRIAADVYGDSTAWSVLAVANDLRDPGALIPGETLVIP